MQHHTRGRGILVRGVKSKRLGCAAILQYPCFWPGSVSAKLRSFVVHLLFVSNHVRDLCTSRLGQMIDAFLLLSVMGYLIKSVT